MVVGLVVQVGVCWGMEDPNKSYIWFKTQDEMLEFLGQSAIEQSSYAQEMMKKGKGTESNPIELPETSSYVFSSFRSLLNLKKEDADQIKSFFDNLSLAAVGPLGKLVEKFKLRKEVSDLWENGLKVSGKSEELGKALNRLFVRNLSGAPLAVGWAIRDQRGNVHIKPPQVLDNGSAVELGPINSIEYFQYGAAGESWANISLRLHTYSKDELNKLQQNTQPKYDIEIKVGTGMQGLGYSFKIEKFPLREAAAAQVSKDSALAFLNFFPRVKWYLLEDLGLEEYSFNEKNVAEMMDLLDTSIKNPKYPLKWHLFLGLQENASAGDVEKRFKELMSRLPQGAWGKLAKYYLELARKAMLEPKKTWWPW